jgi:two-component SAPR family response regulator
MNIAIVDDEVDARATLKYYLKQYQPDWVLHEADSVASGLALVQSLKPDLVFLDVMMRDGTGFDLLKQLPAISFKLVIISGHQEFALQAFRFSAIDYLIKPLDADEFARNACPYKISVRSAVAANDGCAEAKYSTCKRNRSQDCFEGYECSVCGIG